MLKFFSLKSYHEIILIGLVTLLIQASLHYSAKFFWFDYFNPLILGLRTIPPLLLILFIFKGQWKEFGWHWPVLDPQSRRFMIGFLVLMPILSSWIFFSESYSAYYSNSYANESIPAWNRLAQFLVFSLSTFIGWSLLNRSFLLFGIYSRLQRAKVSPEICLSVSLLIVALFEVSFHLTKPPVEALGFIIASPVFSYLAIRTKSFLLPTLCHFYIEFLFIGFILLKHS